MWSLWLVAARAADVGIVPGCPAEADGRVSDCQWRRAVWAAHEYHAGAFAWVIPSGSAVHNRFVEADGLARALVHLGVPADRILPERDAMHTDQNIAWSLAIAESRGFGSVVVASDWRQPDYGCRLVRLWTTLPCTVSRIDYDAIAPALAAGPPALAAPEALAWEPLPRRERAIARATGRARRLPSWLFYPLQSVSERARARPPALPPTLRTAAPPG